MAAAVLIPIAEYLNTTCRPDREYVDGDLLERNAGKWEHARVQALLAGWLIRHEKAWQIQTATAMRTQVAGTRVRIPDVVLVRPGVQPEVLIEAPLLVVEVLSPDDTCADIQRRADDYLQMGIETIWIIDPETRTARVCSGSTWTQTARLEVAGTPIYVELAELFAGLDSK